MDAARQSVGRVVTQSQTSLYICRSCKHRLTRTGISSLQQRFVSNGGLPQTEKTRQKVGVLKRTTQPRNFHASPWSLEPGNAPAQTRSRSVASPEVSQQPTQLSSFPRAQGSTTGQGSQQEEQSAAKYVPAETWEGLQFVGSTGSWEDVPEHETDKFSSWLDSTTNIASDRQRLVACLHQALVECLTCEGASINPTIVSRIRSTIPDESIANAFAEAEIVSSEDQSESLGRVTFASEEQAEYLKQYLKDEETNIKKERATTNTNTLSSPAGLESVEEMVDQPETTFLYEVRDESFLNLRLGAHAERSIFQILKRFSQLSGHRIPDPILNTALSSQKPLSFLIDQLHEQVVQSKPKKLAEVLMNSPGLKQGNIMIFPRRETSVDKEKEVGRWKVIEKELQDRGLPVFGRPKQL